VTAHFLPPALLLPIPHKPTPSVPGTVKRFPPVHLIDYANGSGDNRLPFVFNNDFPSRLNLPPFFSSRDYSIPGSQREVHMFKMRRLGSFRFCVRNFPCQTKD
jgi:hypothetical protein